MTARPTRPDQMRLPLQRDLPEGAEGFVVSDCNRAAVEALADWPNLIGGAMAPVSASGSPWLCATAGAKVASASAAARPAITGRDRAEWWDTINSPQGW